MNERNGRQLSMEHLPRHRHMLEVGWNGRNRRVHAEAIEEAYSFGPFRLVPYARFSCGLVVVHSIFSASWSVVLAKWSASGSLWPELGPT